ncbi:MAG: ornithine carbamoyltransferase [Deltaproteobacteria bacterium]|nr:ornithine carbamoyltransferase [Deltaproteobacteria bacterium]
MKRDFLSFKDWNRDDLDSIFKRAIELKNMQRKGVVYHPLTGKALAMIFEKSSTRTRVSFEVGMFQLGGHAIFMSPRETQIGRGEPVKDTARVLSRYVNGIMIRTFSQEVVEELAGYATVPVINGLTDLLHPCQIMADLLTVIEKMGTYEGLKMAWIGDGNNMANSWIEAAGKLGFDLTLACPKGYTPDPLILGDAHKITTGKIRLTSDPFEAAKDGDVINTDVWASMGQEDEKKQRQVAFKGYQVNTELMKVAQKDAIVLHCLPAHRGEEITEEVIEGPNSMVWDQAENRLHVQKAIMEKLMGGNK